MQFNAYLVTMNARINQLVKSLLLKDSLEQCSLHEVEQFAERYPYFGAAQLLLTKKLQSENPSRYTEQLQKTYLFFHNPLWVEQLLSDTGTADIKKAAPASPVEEKVVVEKTEQAIPAKVEEEAGPVAAAPIFTATTKEEIPAAVQAYEPTVPESVSADTTVQAFHVETVLPVAPVPDVAVENVPAPVTEETPAVIQSETAKSPEGNMEISDQLNDPVIEKEEFNPGMPDAITGNELLFEPYHTVDYFASQGIKFREDEVPKDKFAQQLKSFTGWLRTLKKLPATEMAKTPVSVAEHKVEQLAEYSLKEGDIVTETMAEVWEKQGNNGKAIEIYRKLSLLEPAKSTYFAAKIEELKKLN